MEIRHVIIDHQTSLKPYVHFPQNNFNLHTALASQSMDEISPVDDWTEPFMDYLNHYGMI